MKSFVCSICGYIYDEALGVPSFGINRGTMWEYLPNSWVCPLCGASKADFKEPVDPIPANPLSSEVDAYDSEDLSELSLGELSALCSNLARGCEKQYLNEESSLFNTLADYFKSKVPAVDGATLHKLLELIEKDLEKDYSAAKNVAVAHSDRGAQRALVWSEKVSRILKSLLLRYEKEGDALLIDTSVYVCEVCGFVYIGDAPPELCPVCKVPSWKIAKVERRKGT